MPLMKWPFLIAGILIGCVLHIVSLLAVPVVAPRDAYSRLAEMGAENTPILLDQSDPVQSLPYLDPAFVHIACRFDLTNGPVRVRIPLAGPYVSISFHSRDGTAFFSLNDRSALGTVLDAEMRNESDEASKALPLGAGTIAVASPSVTGFVLARAFAAAPSAVKQLREDFAKAVCTPRG
jgi:uncharacterized membrane protein